MTAILPCECKHLFQDERYGPGMRVHNVIPGTAKQPAKKRCTVCTTER